ncbi:uncharacterized protein LOC132205510 [Neocloeon triangulifer]|uniref:uncharacterized protein LOC132205510 n=1 Tax=Neocloeon triangulifer TaxID=2078957 RepID=UPI00286F9917|nr:uncharacterized protein LOC132205510 [Neocloeon triangulifer]
MTSQLTYASHTRFNTLNLPPFYKNHPEKWFELAEQFFFHVGILSDELKFLVAIKALDEPTALWVYEFTSPTKTDYQRLKVALISKFNTPRAPSNLFLVRQKIQQLMPDPSNLNIKPSHLIKRMFIYSEGHLSDEELVQILKKDLPSEYFAVVEYLHTIDDLTRELDLHYTELVLNAGE